MVHRGAFWKRLTTSYWFIPSLMVVLAASLSIFAIWLDREKPWEMLWRVEWIWSGNADGAREILAVIAGSMITVAGVAFSVTIVALVQSAAQFGPRLLRTFMTDRGNQVVLGTFLATFVYCLLTLRAVRAGTSPFIPDLAITLSLVFALASLGVLIYFFHHILNMLVAERIIERAAEELRGVIEEVYRSDAPEPAGPAATPAVVRQGLFAIPAPASGYLQEIDDDRLVEWASGRGVVVHADGKPGEFIMKGTTLARIAAPHLSSDEIEEVRACFPIGRDQNQFGNVLYPVNQLVEIAVRALSPGVNEVFNALNCLDWLGDGLVRIANRHPRATRLADERGEIRFVRKPLTFDDIAAAALDPIRQSGAGNAQISLRFMEILAQAAPVIGRADYRKVLLAHVDKMNGDAHRYPQNANDRMAFDAAYARAVAALETDKAKAARLEPALR